MGKLCSLLELKNLAKTRMVELRSTVDFSYGDLLWRPHSQICVQSPRLVPQPWPTNRN